VRRNAAHITLANPQTTNNNERDKEKQKQKNNRLIEQRSVEKGCENGSGDIGDSTQFNQNHSLIQSIQNHSFTKRITSLRLLHFCGFDFKP